jgi:hypothetical protein
VRALEPACCANRDHVGVARIFADDPVGEIAGVIELRVVDLDPVVGEIDGPRIRWRPAGAEGIDLPAVDRPGDLQPRHHRILQKAARIGTERPAEQVVRPGVPETGEPRMPLSEPATVRAGAPRRISPRARCISPLRGAAGVGEAEVGAEYSLMAKLSATAAGAAARRPAATPAHLHPGCPVSPCRLMWTAEHCRQRQSLR